jgi:hypothetical protein
VLWAAAAVGWDIFISAIRPAYAKSAIRLSNQTGLRTQMKSRKLLLLGAVKGVGPVPILLYAPAGR